MPLDPLGSPISGLNASDTLDGTETVTLVQNTRTKRSLLSAIADYVVQTATAFTPSGSGAVAEAVSTALKRIVHTDQYSSLANYRTANDALRTGRTGLGGVDVYSHGDTGVTSNTYVGRRAGNTTNTGAALTAVGAGALALVTTGHELTAIGTSAMAALTSGEDSVAVGYLSMNEATAPRWSTAVGQSSARQVTTPDYLTAVGYQSAEQAGSGVRNTCIGAKSLRAFTTGTDNFGGGFEAGTLLTTGIGNIAIGSFSLASATTANNNVAVGHLAGHDVTGGDNVFVGRSAGTDYTTGVSNTFVGKDAGNPSISGSPARTGLNNTAVGSGAGPSAAASNNTVCVGQGATALASNSIAIGRNAVNNKFLGNSTKIGQGMTDANISGRIYSSQVITTVNSDTGVTIANATFLGNVILRTGAPGGGISDTTPAAANLVTLIPGCEVGTGYDLYYHNTTGQTMTLLAGNGVTLSGTTTVANGQTRHYKIRFTNVTASSEAATVYGVSTAAN